MNCPDCGTENKQLHRDNCPRMWWIVTTSMPELTPKQCDAIAMEVYRAWNYAHPTIPPHKATTEINRMMILAARVVPPTDDYNRGVRDGFRQAALLGKTEEYIW